MASAHPMTLFDIAGRAMSAQLVRLNTTASNLANAGSTSSSEAQAFRSMKPVFQTVTASPGVATVRVERIVSAGPSPVKRHDPGSPQADASGNVWDAGVDSTAEMVEMVEAARQYQNNVQVLDTAKSLILDTLRIGR